MQSLLEIRRLLGLGEARMNSCERRLAGTRRQLTPIDDELRAMQQQVQALRDLLMASRLQATTVSHDALFTDLRRQAVMRRQLQEVLLEMVSLETRRDAVQQQIQQHQARQASLRGRQQKYLSVQSLRRDDWRGERLLREEREIEDQLVSRR